MKHFTMNGTMVEGDDGVTTIYIRNKKLTSEFEESKIDVPEWMTPAQTEAISNLYKRNPDGSHTLKGFFKRFEVFYGDFCGAQWCGMFIGIEKDGHTHS